MDHHEIVDDTDNVPSNGRGYRIILAVTYAALFLGSLSASLLSRFYFVHGGSSRWVSAWVQSAGFPLLLVPICTASGRIFSELDARLFVVSTLMGLFLGVNNLFVSWGVSYLPVSTSSLLLSSQLAFNLLLSVLLVGQKLRFTNVNCVVLLTLSPIVLALDSSTDRPEGVTEAEFLLGFSAILVAAAMFAVYLPIMERVYRGVRTYRMVMEMQLVMGAVSTAFAMAGMAADGGFGEMGREGREEFDLGEAVYWAIIVITAGCWQLVFIGTAGTVFMTSSLNGGICATATLVMNVLGGVVALGDSFGGMKAVAVALCLWGFASYMYGEYTRKEEEEKRVGDGDGDGYSVISGI